MQKIIAQTRNAFLSVMSPGDSHPGGSYMPMTIVGRDIMVRKIPSQNYKDLSRLIPISWL
ncbi:MAG: hypothetical protein AAB606_02335 [Patescibacteria group bacterium]